MADNDEEVAALKARLAALESAAGAPPESKAKGKAGGIVLKVGIGVVLLFVGFMVLGAVVSADPCQDTAGAKDYAKRASLPLLKYPQTATFSLSAASVEGCRFHISGTVSSQNGFGNFVPRTLDITIKADPTAHTYTLEASSLIADAVDGLR